MEIMSNIMPVVGAVNIWGSVVNACAWALQKIFELTLLLGIPNYVLAIFIFTCLVKLLIQPMMGAQMKATRKMQQIKPQLEELKVKYGHNKNRYDEEMVRLYQEHDISPFSGCLPLLIQFPILIALFQAMRNFDPAIYNPEFIQYWKFMWIDNLSTMVVDTKWPWLLPILSGIFTFLQQKVQLVNGQAQDSSQKTLMYAMPIMFVWFVRNFPAALAIYWIFYSVIGTAIQAVLNMKWAKEDKILEEERQAALEAEKAEKRAKKEAKRAAIAASKAEYAAKQAAKGGKKKEKVTGVDEFGSEYEEIDLMDTYNVDAEDFDPDMFIDELPEGSVVRRKKVKKNPYSSEFEYVDVYITPDGIEHSLDKLKREARSQKIEARAKEVGLFGGGKKKKK
ncbi:MAG: membrane protein insertase YidC [Firmicutes bacterium]|nr:membrane protein insertase YidC [Bacillota bacterium]